MVEDMLVPPMLLQCFAENAMKYAFRTKKELHLRLDVTSFERDYYPYAKITVRDNGPGFPPEELPTLNACQRIYRNGTPHIGIYNTLARLRFLFGEQVTWRLYNDRGAVCEIVLPATFHDEG